MKQWIDNADSYICPICGEETSYLQNGCKNCGFGKPAIPMMADEFKVAYPLTYDEIYQRGYEAGKKTATEEVLTNIVPLYNCNDIVSNDTCHAYKDCMQCCVDRYRKQTEEKANAGHTSISEE